MWSPVLAPWSIQKESRVFFFLFEYMFLDICKLLLSYWPWGLFFSCRLRRPVRVTGSALLNQLKLRNPWFPGYSQLSPCGHPDITDTAIIRTAAKSRAKINYICLTEIISRYYGLSLVRTLTRGPYGVRNKGSWLYLLIINLYFNTVKLIRIA